METTVITTPAGSAQADPAIEIPGFEPVDTAAPQVTQVSEYVGPHPAESAPIDRQPTPAMAPGSVVVPAKPGIRVPKMPNVKLASVWAFTKRAGEVVVLSAAQTLTFMYAMMKVLAVVAALAVGAAFVYGIMEYQKSEREAHLARISVLVSENHYLTTELKAEQAKPWWKLVFSRSWW